MLLPIFKPAKKLFLLCLFTAITINSIAEGTKQFMPNSGDRLWLEMNMFTGKEFGTYGATDKERIFIYLNEDEYLHFGMKLPSDYALTDYRFASYRVMDPTGTAVFNSRTMVTVGDEGYINNYSEAVAGPQGIKVNGSTVTNGYDAIELQANMSGNYWIEFETYENNTETNGFGVLNRMDRRMALEFFDATVTDATSNLITNPGEPNIAAGRLWSKGWGFTNTSFSDNEVKADFYVFTADEFVNKVEFEMKPYSFSFAANSFGVQNNSALNYIENAQSQDGDYTSASDISEYKIFLNDPDRIVWENTKLPPPIVKVWFEGVLIYDYDYNRTPLSLNLNTDTIRLELNEPNCIYNSITMFKIESNIDGFAAILLDLDKNGYSTDGKDRVLYLDLKKGLNYVLWDCETDDETPITGGVFTASATFLGRGSAHFPLYDVETLSKVSSSSIRPFNKLDPTVYWDDNKVGVWGDANMGNTSQDQLTIENHTNRYWTFNSALENSQHNGNRATLNSWYNAIDLGLQKIDFTVSTSTTKCINGDAPYVGNIFIENDVNAIYTYSLANFNEKFFDPNNDNLNQIRIKTLPNNGTLTYNDAPFSAPYDISAANIGNLKYIPSTDWSGKDFFEWEAQNATLWSLVYDSVFMIVNNPPTVSDIADATICINTNLSNLPFNVYDAESDANDLNIIAYSHDQSVIRNSDISLGGSGENRTISINPQPNTSGYAIIYLKVDDGLGEVIEEFALTIGPSISFTGDTTICDGGRLELSAVEYGLNRTITWDFEGNQVFAGNGLIIDPFTLINVGTYTLNVEKDGCSASKDVDVSISPVTTFSGDAAVCIGERIHLVADATSADYEWYKDNVLVSSVEEINIATAALTDAGTYTLEVSKNTCTNTSSEFEITVIAKPSTDLVLHDTEVTAVNNAFILIESTENNVNYNAYIDNDYAGTVAGNGGNASIEIASTHLSIGNNTVIVKAQNANCELENESTANVLVHKPGITVSSTIGLITTEAGGTASYTIVLDAAPSATVTINISSDDTSEGTTSATSIVFTTTNWFTAQTITITGVNDDVDDNDQTFNISTIDVTSNDNNYQGLTVDDVSVINEDDDTADITISTITNNTNELGTTATFTVVLNTEPTQDVKIGLNSNDVGEGTINQSELTFTSTDWLTSQTVTVTGIDDNVNDGDVTYSIITQPASSLDAKYKDLNAADIIVINEDDRTPIANNDSGTTDEDVNLNMNILLNDSGLDDGGLVITIPTDPNFGTILINSDNSLTYRPNHDYYGADSFDYQVCDQGNECASATVNITINPVNDYVPILTNDSRGTSINSSVVVNVLRNDTGLGDGGIVVTEATPPSNGSIVINSDKTITYTPTYNFLGTDTFQYQVCDMDNDCATATVTVIVKENNINPLAIDDNLITTINTSITANIISNDTGLDDGVKNVIVPNQPANGSANVNTNNTVIYTPNSDFVGNDQFNYTVTDNDGDYSTATVFIRVNDNVNHEPIANNDERGTAINTTVIVDVLENDDELQDGGILVTKLTDPSNGTIIVNTNNTISYTPNSNFLGTDSFGYQVCDIDGECDDATVTITVNKTNTVPVGVDDNFTTYLNTAKTVNVLNNDTNLEDGVRKIEIHTPASNGTAIANADNTITYTPNTWHLGSDSFEYMVIDNQGDYGIATVTFTVETKPNFIPVAVDDKRATAINTAVDIKVLINDTNLDDGGIVVTTTTTPSNGTVQTNNNTVTYTPNTDYLGIDSFNYQITDTDGDSDVATVTINVKETNAIPVAINDTANTYINTQVTVNVLNNDLGLEDGVDHVSIFAQTINGNAIVNTNNTIRYTPANWHSGIDSIKYMVTDNDGDYSIATVIFNIGTKPNFIPVAVDDKRATAINTAVDIKVLINDTNLDDGGIVVTTTTTPSNGTVQANNNIVTYKPNADYLGVDSFNYQVTDADGDSDIATVTINVKETNAIPVAINDTANTYINTPVTVNVLNNDLGLEDGVGHVSIFELPMNGTAIVNANNTINYTPANWFNATDSLQYLIADIDGDLSIATLIINITSKPNFIPIAINDERGTAVNTPVKVDVLFNDTGLEDGGLIVSSISAPTNGSITVNTDNTITYSPTSDYLGYDSFEYQVCDKDGDCATATVSINVKETNAIPVAVNDSVITFLNTAINIDAIANDTGLEDGLLGVSIATSPINGIVTVNADNTITYTPANWYAGTDQFTYVLIDVDGDYSTATIIVDIREKNFAPIASNDNYHLVIGETFTISAPGILANDSDAEGKTLVPTLTSNTKFGELTVNNDGSLSYVHNGTDNSSDSFTYIVSDGIEESNVATVTFSITPKNNLPVAVADFNTIAKDDVSVSQADGSGNLLSNDTDNDANTVLTIASINNITSTSEDIITVYGRLEWTTTGNYTYYLDNNLAVIKNLNEKDSLTDIFNYILSDGNGGAANSTLTITIKDEVISTNEALVATNDTLFIVRTKEVEMTNLLSNDTYSNYDDLNVTGIDEETDSDINITSEYGELNWGINGDIEYVLQTENEIVKALNDGETLMETFTYKITDGTYIDSAKLIVNIIGKSTTDAVTITNGFTPNGDGVAEYFEIKNIEDYPNNTLYVYNRWGTKVYYKKHYDNTWDGKSDKANGILPVGTYFYVLTLEDGKKPLKGYVFLKY